LYCVLVHPDIKVETKHARSVLSSKISLELYVKQSAHLAAFIAGCFKEDIVLIKHACKDFIIENQRAGLIKGFYDVKNAALGAGAIACSISGSGPTVFALAASEADCAVIKLAMVAAYIKNDITHLDTWISPMGSQGARIK
jgi:homoserine kinase